MNGQVYNLQFENVRDIRHMCLIYHISSIHSFIQALTVLPLCVVLCCVEVEVVLCVLGSLFLCDEMEMDGEAQF